MVVQAESPGSRVRAPSLTTLGQRARDAYHCLVVDIENHWIATFGEAVWDLRRLLEHLAGESLLFRGLQPYPDGWRASVPTPDTLPHYPMILHRGGFPDGS